MSRRTIARSRARTTSLQITRTTPQPGRMCRALFAVGLLVLWADGAAAAPDARTGTGSPGFWLLDLAHDQAGRLARAPDRADAVEILCLLKAATRLDPQLSEAWRQQYDLLKGLGREAEALEVLDKYVKLAPDDEPAVLTLVSAQIAAAQTAEKRLQICRQWLAKKNLPPAPAALLHRTIAAIQQNKLQTDKALQHARKALALFPYDAAARRLLLDLEGRRDLCAELSGHLWQVRSNPADTAAVLAVARIADALGMHDEASAWYAQAEKVLARLGRTDDSVSLALADHWLQVDRLDKAIGVLQTLLRGGKAPLEAYLLACEAYTGLHMPQDARRVASKALAMLEAAPSTAATRPSDAADRLRRDASRLWIRLIYLDDVDGTLERAEAVFGKAPGQIWARRCYGWALLKAGRPDKAADILEPTATIDAWSALGRAQALWARGEKEAAAKTLERLWQLAPVGSVWRAARAWSEKVGLTLPSAAPNLKEACAELFQQFDKALFDLPLQPQRFLRLTVSLDPAPPPGAPWFGRIELSNISGLPIRCGAGGAFVPSVLLRAVVHAPASQDIGHQVLFSLEKQLLLRAGQTVSIYGPVDPGPLRQFLRDPSKDVTVMFTAILDPVKTAEGKWRPGPCGLVCEPISVSRPAQPAVNLDDLLRRAQVGSTSQKAQAARTIVCMLLRPEGGSSAPEAEAGATRADAPLLVETLVGLLKDSDPIAVARTLAELDNLTLSEPLAEAAAANVNSPHWLVRLLAIRLFAHQHGLKFTRVLGSIAQRDADPLVRDLAAAYYARSQTVPSK